MDDSLNVCQINRTNFIILPAWKSIPTANEVPDMGISASVLSFGSRGTPRIPS